MQLETAIDLDGRETAFVSVLATGQRPTRLAKPAGYSLANARNVLRRPDLRAAWLATVEYARTVLS